LAVSGVELELMLTAEVPTPYGYVYRAEGSRVRRLVAGLRPGGKVVRSPCLAFAVHHHSAGTILIDTGMHPDARDHRMRDFGVAMGVLFKGMRTAKEPYDKQLRALEIEPERVRRVVTTHLHVDHTSGMRLLPNAEFVCSRAEWAATKGRFPNAKGYVASHLPPESRMELVDFDRDGEPYETFAKTIDLLGDGTIRLVSTPGHTVGHLSVLLAMAGGQRVLLVGDAAYTLRGIREQILPMLTADDDASLRTLVELDAFVRRDPQAILVPSHDPSAWHELRDLSASAQRALAAWRVTR
jgi:N-acyl homoserine lactone hydrolase